MITWILTRTKISRIAVEKIFDFVLFKIEWNRSDSNTLDHAAQRNIVIQYIDDTFLRWNESKLLIEAKIGAIECFFTLWNHKTRLIFTLMSTSLHDLMRLFWMAVHKPLSSKLFIENYVQRGIQILFVLVRTAA